MRLLRGKRTRKLGGLESQRRLVSLSEHSETGKLLL
jgi:hypothetical protein